MKRTIEINDTLQDLIDSATSQVEDALIAYLDANPETDELPDLGNDLDYGGAIHEIIDGTVPIYTAEIEDLFYLYGDEIEQAFDDAGIGSKDNAGWPMGWKPAAIYCYLESQVHEWWGNNAQVVFDTWKEKQPATV